MLLCIPLSGTAHSTSPPHLDSYLISGTLFAPSPSAAVLNVQKLAQVFLTSSECESYHLAFMKPFSVGD